MATQPITLKAEPDAVPRAGTTGIIGELEKAASRNPILPILLVSIIAVSVNCYPIIFCGKSYVSPACVVSLVYDWWPPAPGMVPTTPSVPHHGSDAGAMMWWHVPTGFVQARSLLQQGELPLWNRYGHAGAPLIGQAVSMLEDPLHLFVILGGGSAWAWDIKFLAAKFLFCVGFGLLILKLLKNKRLALIYAALSAYCGAFFFIANHPVFFVLTYAPWILLSALEFLDLKSQQHVRWGLCWLVVNLGCFNAGFIEVAVDLIGGLNLVALMDTLVRQHQPREMTKSLARMLAGTLLFVGLSAPVWIPFLVALDGSYTTHSEIKVTQQPLESLPGAFDDNFFRGVSTVGPGTSLLIFAGVALSLANWRHFKTHSFFWINAAATLVWGGCVFGWLPGPVLAAIPMLNRVGHIATDISYLLVVHLTIQSAYGFQSLLTETHFRRTLTQCLGLLLILLVLLLKYSFLLTYQPVRWYYFLWAGLGGIGAPLLFSYLKTRYHPIPTLGWIGILCLGFIPQHRFGLYTFGDRNSLLIPGPRVALDAPSLALERLTADTSEPFRVVSLKKTYSGDLSGDYAAVYQLEDIRSCAPISNAEYIKLLQHFPGITLTSGWIIGVTNPVQAQPLLSLLNVKFLLTNPADKSSFEPDFPVHDRSDFLVLKNTQAWPRSFFINKVERASSSEEFAKKLMEYKTPFVCLDKETIESHSDLTRLEATQVPIISPATDYRLLANSTSFHIRAPSAGVVCLTECQARNFAVTVNGRPKEVLTVNRAFKGVYLDSKGNYEIKFAYRPSYWHSACFLFWISLSAAIVFAAKAERAERWIKECNWKS